MGKRGQDFFELCYKDLNPVQSNDKKYDLIINGRESLELKSDSYSTEDSENYFFEFYSNHFKKSAGGPWRAMNDGVNHFVYLYYPSRAFFWFNPSDLCPVLDWTIASMKPKYIKNRGYYTVGYAIPRSEVQDLVLREERFDKTGHRLFF